MNTTSTSTWLQYVPFKQRQSPTLSNDEIPPIQGTPVTSIPSNFARFLYPKNQLKSQRHQTIRELIWTQLPSLVPSLSASDGPPQIRFKSRWLKRKQVFVDISMATSLPQDWDQSVIISLPDESRLRFIAHGPLTHRSYFTMSIAGLPQAVSKDDVARMVSKSLVVASLIDAWAEMTTDGDVFTGKMIFVGQAMSKIMVSAREAKKDPLNITTVPVGQHQGTCNKVPVFARFFPSAKPGHKIQMQPGWLFFQGRHYKLVYRDRKRWCTRCKADAQAYHPYKDCPCLLEDPTESSMSESSESESEESDEEEDDEVGLWEQVQSLNI